MKVNLLIIATNKYVEFLPGLIESLDKYFLTDCQVTYNVFTNRVDYLKRHFSPKPATKMKYLEIDHYPWPYTTLYRYHFFAIHREELMDAEYNFYIDADTLIKAPITREDILGDRVGTQHCGFVGGGDSYERNPESTSCVNPGEGKHYFGGGFWGFSKIEFFKMVIKATDMINADHEKGIIPAWHDESVLNRYFIDNPPTKILTPSYHYPESRIEHYKAKWPENYVCKILLLDKNHKELRS